MLNGMIIGAIVGAVAGLVGGLLVVLIAVLQPAKQCPQCGEPVPKFRKPGNRRQALWGGWTCTRCGCELDRRGRRIEE